MHQSTTPKKTVYTVLLLITLLGLVGCASQQKSISQAPTQWQLSGKIAVSTPNTRCQTENCPPSSSQGNLAWIQQNAQFDITLRDPFNRVIMQIKGDTDTLQATAPEQPTITAVPTDFIQQLLNDSAIPAGDIQLTPTDLRYWITGRPAPSSPVTDKQAESFTQNGYQIDAKQWRNTEIGYMPSIIDVKKSGFRLRIIAQRWTR